MIITHLPKDYMAAMFRRLRARLQSRCTAVFPLFFSVVILSACSPFSQGATVPSPPPGFTPPPLAPTKLEDCDQATMTKELHLRAHPPSATTLNCVLLVMFDTDTPISKKSQYLGGNIDPKLLKHIGEIKEQYPYFVFSINSPVTRNSRGKYEAYIDIDVVNNLLTVPAELEFTHGSWKLSRNLTCSIFRLLNHNNPKKATQEQLDCLGNN